MIKLGLSWHYGKIISGVSTVSVFQFEMLHFHNFFLTVCREHVLGVINLLSSLGRVWVSCHHIFLLFRGMSHASVA